MIAEREMGMNYDEVVDDEGRRKRREKRETDEQGSRWMVLLCHC